MTVASTGSFWNSHRYGGKYGYFFDSPFKSLFAGQRWYNPKIRRWINRDPIAYAGGDNMYMYVNDNPVKYLDPSGLDVINLSASAVFVLNEDSDNVYLVPPGAWWPHNQDGLCLGSRPHEVFKLVNGVHAVVNSDGSVTTYPTTPASVIGQPLTGGWKNQDFLEDLHSQGDHHWDNLFNKAN